MKSWGAPPKSLGVRIGNGATRRLTIYAFDPSVSQHVILVNELASRRSARESRGGVADKRQRSLFRYVFNDVEQCSTTALFTARADGRSASPAPLDFCKACLWQVIDASIDLRDPNPN